MDKLFNLGQVVATPGALEALEQSRRPRALPQAMRYLTRHATGDFGVICAEDKVANLDAIQDGNRIMSVYELDNGTKIWIITEADRSSTTILLPEEY